MYFVFLNNQTNINKNCGDMEVMSLVILLLHICTYTTVYLYMYQETKLNSRASYMSTNEIRRSIHETEPIRFKGWTMSYLRNLCIFACACIADDGDVKGFHVLQHNIKHISQLLNEHVSLSMIVWTVCIIFIAKTKPKPKGMPWNMVIISVKKME